MKHCKSFCNFWAVLLIYFFQETNVVRRRGPKEERKKSFTKSRELYKDKNIDIVTNSSKNGGYWKMSNNRTGKGDLKHWTRFYQFNCNGLYGVFSDSEIDTKHLETKLTSINLIIVGSESSRTLKLTNQITVKKFFWIPATIFGILWAIVSIMPVVSNVSRNKFLLVLTYFAIGVIFQTKTTKSGVVAQGVRNLVDVSSRWYYWDGTVTQTRDRKNQTLIYVTTFELSRWKIISSLWLEQNEFVIR